MITYTKTQLDERLGPCVYSFKNMDTFLYIGMTIQGFRRIFAVSHKSAIRAFKGCTHLEIIPCATWNEARALEARMIRQHKPFLNKPKPGGQSRRKSFGASI